MSVWYAIIGTGIILAGLATAYFLILFSIKALTPAWKRVEMWYFNKYIKPNYPGQTGLDSSDREGLLMWVTVLTFVFGLIVTLGYFLGEAVMT